jgi:hypothetical protein
MLEIMPELKTIFEVLIKYGFPTVAIILSFLSYIDAKKAKNLQDNVFKLEEQLKRYELEEKEKEREEATKPSIEARIVNIARHKYKLKVWNSGKSTAYNVDFQVPTEYNGVIWKDKAPYEFLGPKKSFEEHVIVHSGTPSKFIIKLTWESEQGDKYTEEQLLSI